MITRIESRSYRCFERLALSLDRFQVFVGPNGSGKTTLLDIPIVLGEMLSSRSIETAFFRGTPSHPRPRADSAGDLIYKRSGQSFILAVEARIPQSIASSLLEKQASRLSPRAVDALRAAPQRWLNRIRYEIELEVFNDALQIAQEHLLLLAEGADVSQVAAGGLIGEWLSERSRNIVPVISRPRGDKVRFFPEAEARGRRNDYGFPPTEPAFANVFADRSRYGASLWFRDLLTADSCAYQPSVTVLRDPQPRIQHPLVVRDASTLPWLAYQLKANAEDAARVTSKGPTKTRRAFESWERLARLALQGLVSIEPVVRDDDKRAYLRLHYRNGATVPSSALSDGTLILLAVTILPFLPTTPLLMTYEEPENGVHPKGIEILLQALQTIHGSQVFVSSHSPLVLAKCLPSQVVCLSLDDRGAATAIRGDQHPALVEWKDSISLGSLLAAGVLG
jgi:predicted ATPase